MIELTTGVAFLLTSMYGAGNGNAIQASITNTDTDSTVKNEEVLMISDREELKTYLKQEFKDAPLLYEIARCESTFTHYKEDGEVLRGRVDNRDVGVMQINEKYHLDRAIKLGFDIHTLEGNVAYAKFLYSKQGAQPWSASAPCWSKGDLAVR